ncbi:MAG: MMPL family transporter, partial [Candidatus Altiarchaeales archaeon]|nr:MMPL family transporter [Candidatus Altiarchaeales archaeon]
EQVYEKLDALIKDTKKPPGIKAYVVGGPALVEIDRLVGPEMGRVMRMTMGGIIVVVFLVMQNIAYGILPLFTIFFGTAWSMAMWAGLGQNLTYNTSGVSSLIMGIGIDFGIQTITRFRQELKIQVNADKALSETLANVITPMSTTTLAALIGFRAMAMGELTFLGEMGSIMSLGVLGCMLATLTIVPALMIIYVKHVKPIKLWEVFRR